MKRRQALSTILAAGSASLLPRITSSAAKVAANDRIQVGVIGLGSRGFNLIDDLLAQPDVEITMISDLYNEHYRDREWGKGPRYGFEPAREKIQQHANSQRKSGKAQLSGNLTTTLAAWDPSAIEDLDAVVIATPDHWHATLTLCALKNGKAVYCEKPVTHTFAEGQAVYREVAKQNAVFQTGSQQRSEDVFQRAVNLIRNGHLGKVTRFEVGLPPGYDQPQGDPTVTEPPEGGSYNVWCGPAEPLPYMRARHHRWWRGNRNFGGGVLMDWIGHHNDIAHWALGFETSGPIKVEAKNWTMAETPVYNTPHHYEIESIYSDGTVGVVSDRFPVGTRFEGENGWLFVTRGKIEGSNKQWLAKDFETGPKNVMTSPGHMRNFIDAIRFGKPTIAPAEQAHRSITPGHLGYVSHAIQKPLQWDPVEEVIVGDPAADKLLKANYDRERSAWDYLSKS